MPSHKSLLAWAAALMAPLCAGVLATTPALGLSPARQVKTQTHTLLQSRLLWATIDVCDPADEPNTVGIRGSMPADGHAHDTMYMRFRLQYLSPTTKHWVDLGKGTADSYVKVGTGALPRQGGRSFKLGAGAGKSAFTMRGVVTFQWRHGGQVLASASRPTTAGRESLAGADPPGFSAATCVIS